MNKTLTIASGMKRSICAAIVSGLLFAAVGVAQESPVTVQLPQAPSSMQTPSSVETPVSSGQEMNLPPRVGITRQVSITLQDVIAQVLANNKDIGASKIDLEKAGFSLTGAKGAYDPVFGVQSYYERQVTPVSSILGGSSSGKLVQNDYVVRPQLNGLLPFGGSSYGVQYSSDRLNTDNQFATLNPQFTTSLAFTFTQPLLRGLRFDDTRRQIEVAKKNQALTNEQFRQEVMDVAAQAAQGYWELVFASENLRVQIEGADLARRQVQSNQTQADRGILAPIDVVEAQTQLATLEQNVFQAQSALTRAENALKSAMLPDRFSPVWSAALHPVTPVNTEVHEESIGDAVTQAIANRPELAQARISASVNETNSRFLRDQTKPQVDLIGSYTAAGLAGRIIPNQPNPITGSTQILLDRINELSVLEGLTPLPPISTGGVPPLLVGGYGQSLSNLFAQHFPTVQVGVQVSLPLRNRTAQANLASSQADGRRIKLQQEQLEELIEADVRNAIQAVESSKARLASAASARDSADQQYASEQRKFQAGTSTVFLVLQRQTAMISARSQYLRAEADLGNAVEQYQRTIGETLTTHNINLTHTP